MQSEVIKERLKQELNPDQLEACLHTEGPLLIFAGAGSGKTRVLGYRTAYLISAGIKPWNILAVTFTNKAAKELKERICNIVGEDGKQVMVGTFHSIAVQMLRMQGQTIGIRRDFMVYDEDDRASVLKKVMSKAGVNAERTRLALVQYRISTAKNNLIGPDEYTNNAADKLDVKSIYKMYQTEMRDLNALDFDDLIFYSVEMLKKSAEALNYFQERMRYILVDEYQDTNQAQYQMIHLLASRYRNICVVGDDDQAIYSWRGANVQNILQFKDDYPDAKVVTLEQNYRSTQPILMVANSVIRNNQNRAEKSLWTLKREGVKPMCYRLYSESDEANFVAQEIKRLLDEGIKPKDIAVVYRINAQSRAFEEALLRAGVPYRVVGGIRFYERKEIKDILAYLRFLMNPRDTHSFARLVGVPKRNIGPATIDTIETYCRSADCTVMDALATAEDIKTLPKQIQPNLRVLYEQLSRAYKAVRELPTSQAVKFLLDIIDAESFYRDGSVTGDSRWENIIELLGLAGEYDHLTPPTGMESFLADISLVSDQDDLIQEQDAVTLMTMHAAKGLEYRVVFVCGLEEGIIPHERSIRAENGIEEERRLFYVAATRAKERLYLLHAFWRHLHGRSRPSEPSRFLAEIPPDLIQGAEEHDEAGAAAQLQGILDGQTPKDQALDTNLYKPGQKVRHAIFGAGKIVEICQTSDDIELVIDFGDATRRFLASLAKLSILDDAHDGQANGQPAN